MTKCRQPGCNGTLTTLTAWDGDYEGCDTCGISPLVKPQIEVVGEHKRYREALELIAAQDSGIVGSTSKADCMAAIARAVLNRTEKGGKDG